MATKKSTSKASGVKNISDKQLRRIWGELKPLTLLERLRSLKPDNKWSLAGNRISGCCPFHEESSPSFHIYLDRGYAKCFGGTCERFTWNPIEFWALLKNSTWLEALADLKQTFGLKFLASSINTQLTAWERNQLVKKKIADICHDELVNAINLPTDPNYAFAKDAVTYLLKVRSLNIHAIPVLSMLGVMPPLARVLDILDIEAQEENQRRLMQSQETGEKLNKFTSLADEARAYLETAKGWIGALVFRLDTAPGTLGRLKLRRPDTRDMLILPDAFEEDIGFLGLGWGLYASLFGAAQKYVQGVHVVEGEFDALSVMAEQSIKGGPNCIVISAGGTGGERQLDSLKAIGFDEIYLVPDSPNKNGDEVVKSWLPNIKDLRTRIFVGYNHFQDCGDPDEIVVKHGLSKLDQLLLQVKDRTIFQPPHEWAFDRAQPEIEAIDDSDLRQRVEVATNWGQLLKSTIECDAFIESCAKAFNFSSTILKRQIVAKEEDEPAFILRLVDVLKQIFFVIGQRSTENDRRIFLWHKEKRRIVQVALADEASIERQLGPMLGALYQFLSEKVGIPTFLEPPEAQKALGKYLRDMDANIRWYMRQALIIMAQDTPDFDIAEQKGQGIHIIRGKNSSAPAVYFVNGRDVFLGTFDVHGNLSWKELEGPSHDGIVFDVGIDRTESAWIPWIESTSDLSRAKDINPTDVWNRLHRLVDTGWRYKNHAVTAQFLTSHIMASAVCDAFRRKVMVGVHADTRSGKSRLLMGLIGGTDHNRIHVLAIAVGMPKYTSAGIRQDMKNKARPLCLDEFEDDGTGDKNSREIGQVLEMFRGLTGENNTITQGSRHNKAQHSRLVFNVFIAAINKARKVQDANRMVTVYMERVDNRPDPVQILLQEFGSSYIQKLKEDLAICLLPHLDKLQIVYDEIEEEYGKPGIKPATVDSRIFEGLYQSLTVMKLLGMDYRKFALDFCEANKEILTVAASHTDSMELFHWLSQTACIPTRFGPDGKDRHFASLLQMLATPELRDEINLSGTGLFYDESTRILVINWTMAIQRVLSGHAKYGKETNVFNLRELANRAPHSIKAAELDASGALSRLRPKGLAGVPTTHLTAYRLDHIINSLNEPNKEEKVVIKLVEPPVVKAKEMVDDGDFS